MSKTEKNQEVAAAKAGMDIKTARRYFAAGKLPSELIRERSWRTRPDPFGEVWEEIRKLLANMVEVWLAWLGPMPLRRRP